MQPVVGFIAVLQKNEAPGTTFLLRLPVHNIHTARGDRTAYDFVLVMVLFRRGDQNLLTTCRSFQNVITCEPDVGPCRKSLWPRVDECQ
jgi:hypothetical protein